VDFFLVFGALRLWIDDYKNLNFFKVSHFDRSGWLAS